jgi:hypothetical protein
VVPFHSDGDATGRHPAGERNFLLALTAMRGSASLVIESSPGRGDFKALHIRGIGVGGVGGSNGDCSNSSEGKSVSEGICLDERWGELLSFQGHDCVHGNYPNLEEGAANQFQ